MSAADELLKPQECVMLLVDFQAGLGLAVEAASRQAVLNSAVALARVGCCGEMAAATGWVSDTRDDSSGRSRQVGFQKRNGAK